MFIVIIIILIIIYIIIIIIIIIDIQQVSEFNVSKNEPPPLWPSPFSRLPFEVVALHWTGKGGKQIRRSRMKPN